MITKTNQRVKVRFGRPAQLLRVLDSNVYTLWIHLHASLVYLTQVLTADVRQRLR